MAQKELTDYAEIQQMEIDALKSIFMEDFEEEEMKAAAWNVSSIAADSTSLLVFRSYSKGQSQFR